MSEIVFGPGETLIRRGPAIYLGGYAGLGEEGVQGELLLTNKRLAFTITKKVGFLGLGGKRTEVVFNIPISNVMMARVDVTGILRKSKELVITLEDLGTINNVRFRIEDPEGWRTAIQKAMSEA